MLVQDHKDYICAHSHGASLLRGLHSCSLQSSLYLPDKRQNKAIERQKKRLTFAFQDSSNPGVMHLPCLLHSAERFPPAGLCKLRRGHLWDPCDSQGLLPCVPFLPRLPAPPWAPCQGTAPHPWGLLWFPLLTPQPLPKHLCCHYEN